MIDGVLREHLLTLTTVTALVPRVYIDLAPQSDPLPRLVLRLLPGGERQYHSLAATDMVMADIEATIQAATYEACHAIYEAIRGEIDFVRETWGETEIDCAKISPPHSSLNLPIHGDETGVPSLIATVSVTYREPAIIGS